MSRCDRPRLSWGEWAVCLLIALWACLHDAKASYFEEMDECDLPLARGWLILEGAAASNGTFERIAVCVDPNAGAEPPVDPVFSDQFEDA